MLLRIVLSLFAFLVLAALIGLLGPIVALGESKPLESILARLIAIAIVFLMVFTPLLVTWLKRRAAEKALKTSLTRPNEKAQVQSAKIEALFNQAIQTLKSHQVRKSIFDSRAGLYELPWYVFIGPPGSGKTTALKNAGLRFPLRESLGQDAIAGVGGTRNCDWWFTDKAVLIDTAGRFTTQDSDHSADPAAWRAFLRLLSKHRPQQPINGVLLTLSTQDLLAPQKTREELADKLGLRLQEMIRSLGVCPPVYVLLTKMDLLPGFRETFGKMNEEQRAQGWGVNFEYPNVAKHAVLETLPRELDQLVARLNAQLNALLDQEENEATRVRQFAFAHECTQIKAPLVAMLLRAVEGDGPFEKPVVLRGVYFTSGTQDGTTFDRISSGLARIQNIGTAAHPHAFSPAAGTGKSFFIRDVLQQLIFAEKHLAGYVRKRALLQKWGQLSLLACTVLLTVLLIAAWTISYRRNAQASEQAIAKAHAIEQLVQQFPPDTDQALGPLFVALNQYLASTPETEPALLEGLGLNQQKKLRHAQAMAYKAALRNSLMPRIAKRLETRLAAALENDLELSYESLKAFLMLYQTEHFDEQALSSWVIFDWDQHVLPRLNPDLRESAKTHLANAIALGTPDTLPAINQNLVAQARKRIASQPIENRVYNRIKRFYKPESIESFNLIQRIGPNAASVFERKSQAPLSQGPSGLFTKAGYLTLFYPQLAAQTRQMSQEAAWVMGQPFKTDTPGSKESIDKVRQLYIQEYMAQWDSFLKDIQMKRPSSFDAAVDLSRLLAANQSPLRKFLEAVTDNTRLAAQTTATQNKLEDKANQAVSRSLPNTVALLTGPDFKPVQFDNPLEQQVDDHFHEINALFSGTPAAYTHIHVLLNELYAQLAGVAAAQKSQSAPPDQAALNSIKGNASLLPEPVKSLVTQLASVGTTQGRTAERANLSAELHPLQETCQKTMANRYPFYASSSLDALPQDFSLFFGPGGQMDQFFSARLTTIIDTGSATWQFKPLADGTRPTPTAGLVQFQRAARIRDVFFPGGKPSPAFEVEMRLIKASNPNDVFYMEMNGDLKMFSSQFEPVHRIQWTAQSASSQLRIRASNDSQFKVFNGPWALFRLFDNSTISTTERPEKFKALVQLNGKQFEFEILANSAFNPLRLNELRQFRCPGAL